MVRQTRGFSEQLKMNGPRLTPGPSIFRKIEEGSLKWGNAN